MTEPNQYESSDETATRMGVPVKTLYHWRLHGNGPPAYRIGKRLLFVPAEVDAWVKACGDTQGSRSLPDSGATSARYPDPRPVREGRPG
jgi:excisionase family DNA binding protein